MHLYLNYCHGGHICYIDNSSDNVVLFFSIDILKFAIIKSNISSNSDSYIHTKETRQAYYYYYVNLQRDIDIVMRINSYHIALKFTNIGLYWFSFGLMLGHIIFPIYIK